MDLFKKCSGLEILNEVRKKDIYPYFHTLESKQAPEVFMEGKEVIMIGSNNYLGLTSHPEVIEASIIATQKYGSGCSGSRFLNGTLDAHVALEKELAQFLDKEDAVTFSTGFQSNLGIISAIAGRSDYTDGVFSMSGDICKLPEIVKLAKKYGARIMVDDAHGLGVLGAHGRGTAEHFDLEKEVDIYMGTFSKSLASLGGYMVAKKEVCDYVRHVSRPFIFSASITPASVASARKALEILKREPERVSRLKEISNYMRKKLLDNNIAIIDNGCSTPIIPILTYQNIRTFVACKKLFERGVYVNPTISPAVPVGQSIIRTSYMSTHTEEQMDKAIFHIKAVMEQIKDINE